MNLNLLEPEIRKYIQENQNEDIRKISLQKPPFANVSSAELAQQIKGIQIAKKKFPSYFENEKILYPPGLNLEQSSSELTSLHKSKIVSGEKIVDLTSGFGIDSFGFSHSFKEVWAIEQNEKLSEISDYNFKVLGKNIQTVSASFETFLNENPNEKFDVVYLDPSRRKGHNRKFLLEDLEPNILDWMDVFFKFSPIVLVKLSPLLDIHSALSQLNSVKEIHIVAVKNEVKELLFLCENKVFENPKLVCVNLETNQPGFEFNREEEFESESQFSEPKKYIYEPNPAILKSGAFKLTGKKFNLKKLQTNTHLYTSDELDLTFPGRIYEVKEELNKPKKQIQKQALHLLVKNYPMKTEEVKRKFQIKEGTEETLIFTRSIVGNHILKAKRIGGVNKIVKRN